MKTKNTQYRLRNWKEYNRSLTQRGSLTLWLDEEVVQAWRNAKKTGKRGASKTYSDLAVTSCLSLGLLFRLPLRQSCGLIASILVLLGASLPCPHFSTLSRRRSSLPVDLGIEKASSENGGPEKGRYIALDSTGLKIYGEGEWKVKKHGVGKRRTWRKLHLSVDVETGEILACEMTGGDAADGPLLEFLVASSEYVGGKVDKVSADGAYDSWAIDEYLAGKKIKALIPPGKGSKIRQRKRADVVPLPRDERLRSIRRLGFGDFERGRRLWSKESGYSLRSLSETCMMRQKSVFGPSLRSREESGQRVECLLRCRVLNVLTRLGMPESYAFIPGKSTG